MEDGFVVGGEIDRVEVSLRIAGDALDPQRITRMLGVTPTFAARKGDVITHGESTVTQQIGIWTYKLPASSEWELGDAIQTLLERLPADPALWETLAGEFKTDVFCGLFLSAANRGTELRVETMALLAERRLTLGLDIYARGAE
jgi:hypothetical protein